MTEEQKVEQLLRDCGREIAAEQMLGAVETADSEKQMNNQIYTLRWAAIHMLATEAMNIELMEEDSFEGAMNGIVSDITHEFNMLKDSGEISMVRPGEKLSDPDSEPTLN